MKDIKVFNDFLSLKQTAKNQNLRIYLIFIVLTGIKLSSVMRDPLGILVFSMSIFKNNLQMYSNNC